MIVEIWRAQEERKGKGEEEWYECEDGRERLKKDSSYDKEYKNVNWRYITNKNSNNLLLECFQEKYNFRYDINYISVNKLS